MQTQSKKGLTKRQKEVLDAIKEHIELFEYSPSYEELAQKLGTQKSNVSRYVHQLVYRGYLIKGHGARTLSIAKDESHV